MDREVRLKYTPTGGHRHMAHWLVAKTARELAESIYEDLAKDNAFYRRHPDQKAWVEAVHGSLLQQAREALASILNDPRPTISEERREQIAEALIMDASLRRTKDNRAVTIS